MATVRVNKKERKTTKESQFYNPATGNCITRSGVTGKFIIVRVNQPSAKRLSGNQVVIKANPSVKRAVALRAERSVVALINNRVKKRI